VPPQAQASKDEQLYLVERYWPGIDEPLLQASLPRLERAADEISAEGRAVDHVGSLLVPGDQVVFSVIRAESAELVLEVNERAGLPVDRVAPVTSHGFDRDRGRAGKGDTLRPR
jgi:Nickel responsive protein SCO4226-like